MTYQRNMRDRRLALEPQQNVADEAAEGEVRDGEVGADDGDGDDHDDRGGGKLTAAGPLDLLELGPRLADEPARAAAALALRAGLALRRLRRPDGRRALLLAGAR